MRTCSLPFPLPSSLPSSLSFSPSSFPSSSLFSSLSPSADYHKSYLRATNNHSVSNSSNKPIHMYPQLLEGEISSGLHTYVARLASYPGPLTTWPGYEASSQTGRQTDTDRQTQTDRQTDGSPTLSRGLHSSKRQQCQISAGRSDRRSC